MKKIFLLPMILCLVSCGSARYYNSHYRYSIAVPENFIIIEDGMPTAQSEQLKSKIAAEGALPIYQGVDAAFYEENAAGPVFDTITVTALNKPFSMKQIESSQAILEAMFLQMLSERYSDVRLLRGDFQTFRTGRAYQAVFTFSYQNVPCRACVVLLTPSILFSCMFTMMCPMADEDAMTKSMCDMINSFKYKVKAF